VLIILGSMLIVFGLLYLFRTALDRKKLSDPHRSKHGSSQPTLEPRQQGVRFLGLGRNWPGLAMMAVGAILLISLAY
jgi:uncharacterized iron-regulated membrane protein